jgi:hypothetical protein
MLCFALGFVSVACASVTEDPPISSPDRVVFDEHVYPILVRDCGHSGCHGSEARFFRVVGPGHVRLDPTMRLADPVTESELALSYNRARSLLNAGDPNNSPLLLKPLEVSAGGSEHEGTDSFGRNVYRSPEDPDFQVLVHWALGALQ